MTKLQGVPDEPVSTHYYPVLCVFTVSSVQQLSLSCCPSFNEFLFLKASSTSILGFSRIVRSLNHLEWLIVETAQWR